MKPTKSTKRKDPKKKARSVSVDEKHRLYRKKRIFTEEWKRNLSLARIGKKRAPFTEEHKRKIGYANKGKPKPQDEKSPHWKGDDVGYSALRGWISKVLGKPTTCQNCKKIGLTGRKIHWANKSGRYLRNLNDWIRLCSSCHQFFDRRDKTKWNENMKKYKKPVVRIDGNGLETVFTSITEAAKSVSGYKSAIQNCLKNKQKTAYGFIWKKYYITKK